MASSTSRDNAFEAVVTGVVAPAQHIGFLGAIEGSQEHEAWAYGFTSASPAEVDGKRLDDIEFLLFFLLLVDAGGDTTRNLLSSGLIALLENPEQLAWLKADLPARVGPAREELLRWTSPVIYMRRTAKRDVVLAGEEIREGQKVVMYFGAANRDPEKFADPNMLSLSRTPNEHIAFGTGPHGCLGQHIARFYFITHFFMPLSQYPFGHGIAHFRHFNYFGHILLLNSCVFKSNNNYNG